MAQATLNHVLEKIKTLEPEELLLLELAVQTQRQQPQEEAPPVPKSTGNVWALLAEKAGSVDAPEDWSEEHDRYIYGAPKRYADKPATTR